MRNFDSYRSTYEHTYAFEHKYPLWRDRFKIILNTPLHLSNISTPLQHGEWREGKYVIWTIYLLSNKKYFCKDITLPMSDIIIPEYYVATLPPCQGWFIFIHLCEFSSYFLFECLNFEWSMHLDDTKLLIFIIIWDPKFIKPKM